MPEIKERIRDPVFGVISVLLPLVGFPLAYFSTTSSQEGDGWDGAMRFVIKILLIMALGFISAVASLARSEKHASIAWLGLFLSLLPIILLAMKK
jgi:hypothetical protein